MSTFEPGQHLMQLRGKGGTSDYMPVKWRLVWLRSEHPDATTGVEHVEIGPDVAIFRATVSIPGGGTATDYGSETPKDFGDYIEKAATKALGRALAQLGYGTQFVGEELDEGGRIVDSPVDRRPQPAPARNAAPAFATPRAASAPAPAARQDEAERARADALTQFGPVPATLPEVEAQLAPLAKQVRTNDESLSPGEYQRYHDLEARRKELLAAAPPEPIKLTEDQEKTIAQAWEMAEASETYGATAALMRTLKIAATEAQWAEINRRWSAIRRTHYPQTTQAAQPASYAG